MADTLSTYRSKRDFEKTLEPSGAGSIKPTNRFRFVIQKHDATRLRFATGAGWGFQVLGGDQGTVA